MRAALVAAVALAIPQPADACSGPYITMFEMFEEATNVAHVVVRSIPETGAGAVALGVRRMLKGKKRAMLVGRETNTSCSVGYRKGKQAIVFLDKAGHTVAIGAYREDFKAWLPILGDSWATASQQARRALLVDIIEKSDNAEIIKDAILFLVDEPALLVSLDADEKFRIENAAPPKNSAMPQLLARLKGGALEKLTDATKLADIIDAGKGESDPNRIAALERCERVHGKRLYAFTRYHNGVASHFWKTLAEACRTGTPHRW